MIQVGKYPIYINFANPQSEERMEYGFARRNNGHMIDWLQRTGRRLYETIPSGPTLEAATWEGFVARQFEVIVRSRIGNILFGSLNPGVKVWIVPFHRDERKLCGCGGAGTLGLFSAKQGGGVRLFFNRDDPEARGYYGPDDVLFHEMVHAYRKGWGRWKDTPFDGYVTAEEFLATHMTNVYLDGFRKRRYYFSHIDPQKRSKGDIYSQFIEDGMPLLAIKYFLDQEPLARTVASWMLPSPDFNPWRDYPQLVELFNRENGTPGGRMVPF